MPYFQNSLESELPLASLDLSTSAWLKGAGTSTVLDTVMASAVDADTALAGISSLASKLLRSTAAGAGPPVVALHRPSNFSLICSLSHNPLPSLLFAANTSSNCGRHHHIAPTKTAATIRFAKMVSRCSSASMRDCRAFRSALCQTCSLGLCLQRGEICAKGFLLCGVSMAGAECRSVGTA
jgi:hypothetical protein